MTQVNEELLHFENSVPLLPCQVWLQFSFRFSVFLGFFFKFKNFSPPFSCHSVRNVKELKFLKPQLMELWVPIGDLSFGWEHKFIYCFFFAFLNKQLQLSICLN